MREPIQSVLVLHDQPSQLQGILEAQHPQVDVFYAQDTRQVESILAEHNPQACFSINCPALPPSTMRMAGLHRSVKWFHVGGSGIDKMLPWGEDNALMTNGAGVLAQYLAETVTGAILSLNNNFQLYQTQQSNRVWQQHLFKPLCEQTLLIVGLGAVGERVAANAKALGMRVIATKRSNSEFKNIDALYLDSHLDEVIEQADFVSLHLPLSENTGNLIDEKMLRRMKKGACLINTARGGIVCEKSLITMLRTGHLKAAYFDVFAQEPLPVDSPLWSIDNLMITPHMADGVFEFEKKYFQFFSDNLARWNTNQALLNQLSFS